VFSKVAFMGVLLLSTPALLSIFIGLVEDFPESVCENKFTEKQLMKSVNRYIFKVLFIFSFNFIDSCKKNAKYCKLLICDKSNKKCPNNY
jgi:hypothetical protein